MQIKYSKGEKGASDNLLWYLGFYLTIQLTCVFLYLSLLLFAFQFKWHGKEGIIVKSL